MEETVTVNGVEYVRKEEPPKSIEEQRRDNPHWPWILGKQYIVRTVTFHDVGTLVGVTEHELVFAKAAWIADSGRWWDFITGRAPAKEVEPFDEEQLLIVGRGSLSDATICPGKYEVQK